MRIILAIRIFFRTLFDKAIAAKVEELLNPSKKAAKKEDTRLPAEAAQLLTLFQRDGRLVDFLMESVDGFPDAQVGAIAKQLHRDCRKVLQDYITIEPVRAEEENARATVEAGFDPSAVRLTGQVVGDPPFTGHLRHHGWKAVAIKLPKLPHGADPAVIAPAEIEISQ